MKDSKQIAESVFRKSEERLQEKKRRIAVIRRNTMIASGMCAVLLIGFGIWKNDALKHAPERDPHSSVITETETTTVSSAVQTTSSVQETTDSAVSTETTLSGNTKTTKTTALTSKNDKATTTQTTVSDEDLTTEDVQTEETETSAHTTKHTTEHTTRKTQTTTARTTNTTAKTTIRTTRATTAQTTIARTTRITSAHTDAPTTPAKHTTTTTIQYSHHVTTRVTTSDNVEPSLPPITRVTTIATSGTPTITTLVSPEIIEITETEWQFDTMNAETVTLEFITEPYSRIDISAEWYLSDDVSWTAIADSEGRITITFSTDGFSGTVDIKADDPESDVKLINILYDGEDRY